jgi:hypothetical protein
MMMVAPVISSILADKQKHCNKQKKQTKHEWASKQHVEAMLEHFVITLRSRLNKQNLPKIVYEGNTPSALWR